jgi:hypothetical protein
MKVTKEVEVGDVVVLRSSLNTIDPIKMTVIKVAGVFAEFAYFCNGVIVKEEVHVNALVAVEM